MRHRRCALLALATLSLASCSSQPGNGGAPADGSGGGGGGGGGVVLPGIPELYATALWSGVLASAEDGNNIAAACRHGIAVFTRGESGWRDEGHVSAPMGPAPRALRSGSAFFVAAGTPGVHLCSVAVPSSPLILATLTRPGSEFVDLALVGTSLYIADSTYGLRTADVVDPTSPRMVSELAVRDPRCVAASGDGSRAYVGTADGRVVSVAITASSASLLGEIDLGDAAAGSVAERERLVYAVMDGVGLTIVNATVPARMDVLGSLAIPGARRLALGRTHAFVVATGESGDRVVAVDVSDPLHPTAAREYPVPGIVDVTWSADRLCLSRGSLGPATLEVVDPTNPQPGVEFAGPSGIRAVAASGGVACVGAREGIVVVDGSRPRYPAVLGTLPTPTSVTRVAVSGALGVAACEAGPDGVPSLHIVDLSDRSAPRIAASIPTDGLGGVDVVGTRCYLATGPAGLQVLDLADPARPSQVGSLVPESGSAGLVVAADPNVYCADAGTGRLYVVDASRPDSLRVAGTVDLPAPPVSLARSAQQVVACLGAAGIAVVDVSDPAAPKLRGRTALSGQAGGAVVAFGVAFVAAGDAGLRLVDLTQPDKPRPYVFLDTPGTLSGIALDGATMYAADGDALLIMGAG